MDAVDTPWLYGAEGVAVQRDFVAVEAALGAARTSTLSRCALRSACKPSWRPERRPRPTAACSA